MEVNVAGAGAGKTTRMADLLTEYCIPEGKMVFCIAFTNAAAENISEKVEKKFGKIPDNIKIGTIHSFLFQELINPYYYFLYGKHFEQLSIIDLPTNEGYKRAKLAELESDGILHITKIPEKAKWVAYLKSSDRKPEKDRRKRLMSQFASYCAAVFVDEAQDISDDIGHILNALEKVGVEIILYGDPKQDVKGLGCFKTIMNTAKNVRYISNCHRCPQMHLNISNMLASSYEQQVADSDNAEGSVCIIFESDIDNIQSFLDTGDFGLKYISKKRERFATHEKNDNRERFETLRHEVYRAMSKKWRGRLSELEINRGAFFVTEQMLKNYNYGNKESSIISDWVNGGAFDRLDNKQFAQMVSAFSLYEEKTKSIPIVRSIEIVKGLEAERCLFILTTDLAPYLFRIKTEDNKMSHLLYVALTRSLNHLSILITKEVEAKFTKDFIKSYFKKILMKR